MTNGPTTSTASVLFTDLVGSTELRTRLGEEEADDVRRRHDEVVAAAIEEAAGRVVKSTGDGLMAVFDSAADAVAAAIAAQQRVRALGDDLPEPIVIRVGVSVGDVSFDGDDCFGTAVNEAARLCDSAQGGQVLVADLVRALTRGRGGHRFESVGTLELKGLPDPVEACAVGWDPLPNAADNDLVPFPPALVPSNRGTYVGRPDVRDALRDLWDETKLEGPRTGLLVGEPGIGKTRTAYEIAMEARESGAVVLFGRCDDELQVPYQPFVEALDWQTEHAPELPLGRLPGELARLVPDLTTRCSGLEQPVASDPRTEEHRLFEAVASWIAATAEEAGLVLVVDDIHWATKPTLLMLMHTVRQAAGLEGVRLLVIGTYRDTDVDRAHPLSAVLGDLQRIEGVRRIPVDPLDVDEVIALVEQAAGHPLDDVTRGVAARAHAETEGNPFFVGEVLRHLIESGGVRFVDGRWVVPDPDQIDVPEGVRDVIGQRLSRLSDVTNEVLRAASVIGREFDLDLVGELAGIDEDPLLDAIDDATRARLVEEVDADRYRFAHALVRTSLYDELSASRRRRMHRRATDLIAKRTPDDLAALAFHSVEAGPRGGDLSDAIAYVLAAADQAREARALGEAENLYRKAIELLEEDDAEELDHRSLLARCGIGEILRDQGDASFREELLDVAGDALAANDDELLVRAVLANSRGFTSIVGGIDTDRVRLIEAALARVPDDSVAVRARLEALLAVEAAFDFDRRDERLALVDHAVDLAEKLDDPLTEAWVLGFTRFPDLVPERWTDNLDRCERAVAAADRCGDPTLRVVNRVPLGWKLTARGDFDGARRVAREYLAIAAEEGAPLSEWSARGQSNHFHVYEGDFDRAAAENDATFELGQAIGAPDGDSWWAATASQILWCRDAVLADADLAGQMADKFPGTPTWRVVQAISLVATGRSNESRALIDRFRLADLETVPRDAFWFTHAFHLGRLIGDLDDAGLASRYVPMVEPYADTVVHYCTGVLGPLRQSLARTKAAAGDMDGAVAEGRAALDLLTGWKLGPLTEICRVELAALLARRCTGTDLEEARSVVAEALPEIDRMGMTGWRTRAEQLLDGLA